MASILTDIHVLEGKIDALNIPKDSGKLLYKAYEYDLLVNTHQVDTAKYKESFRYYNENIRAFNRVYDQVLDSLNKKQNQKK